MVSKRLTHDRRREQILTKAACLFTQRGLERTGMRDVAKACKVNEALLYKHFTGKQDLYRQVIVYSQGKAFSMWEAVMAGSPNGYAALTGLLEVSIFKTSNKIYAFSYLVHDTTSTLKNRESGDLVSQGYARLCSFVEESLRRGMADGSIKEIESAENCASCLLSRSIILSMASGVLPPSKSAPQNIDHLLESVTQCLLPDR